MKSQKHNLQLFSEASLVILISLVTLLLQAISFATTWNGSKVYLEDIFPYASLAFALAIQATAYFLSNSLRTKVSLLKCAALLAAICCSTYYSYIGIYNSVNSPASYLQQHYAQITDELTGLFDTELEKGIAEAREVVNDAASHITARYASLTSEQANISACKEALSSTDTSYSDGLRAPRQSAYENYEDYVAAYNAYIAGMAQGNTTETEAVKTQVLYSYGFSSMEDLYAAEIENIAALRALEAALQTTDTAGNTGALTSTGTSLSPDADALTYVVRMQQDLNTAIEEATLGIPFDNTDTVSLNSLLQAAKLCGYTGDIAAVQSSIHQTAKASATPLLADFATLTASLPEGRVTSATVMELKASLDSEILTAILTINSLLPKTAQLSVTDSRFLITDLYLVPIEALKSTNTRLTAVFCLAVAALIDMLSVLFAVSLRKHKPLWERRTLLFSHFEDYAPQIFASLPAEESAAVSLCQFLAFFRPSPETEGDGYMMQADVAAIKDYYPLVALLCQLNLAKIVPAGFLEGAEETLLIKARFIFWCNEIIYENEGEKTEVYA